MRKLKITFLFLMPFVVYGQAVKPNSDFTRSLSYAQVDSLSYHYYLKKDFAALKLLTDEALAQGIDFFYLRSRLAVIAFEKHNYDLAYKYFLKASKKQPDDEVIQEYIFYCLKFNFRTIEAEMYAKNLNQALRNKLLAQKIPSIIPTISIGILYSPQVKLSSDYKGSAGIYAEGNLNGNMVYENFNLDIKVKRRSTLSVGLSRYTIQALGFVQTDLESKTKSIPSTQVQSNFYYRYFIKKGLFVGLGGTYYVVNSAYYTSQYNLLNGYAYKIVNTQLKGYSAVASLSKRGTYFNLGLQYSLYDLNNQSQQQVGGVLKIYLLGNTKVIIGAGLNKTFSQTNHTIINLEGSVAPSKWLQINAGFFSGNMQNYISESSCVTYNTSDPIQQITSFRIDLFYKNIVLSPSLVFQKRESSYFQYTNFTKSRTQHYIYNTQLVNLSLSWKF